MKRRVALLGVAAVLGAGCAAVGAYAAFRATATNSGNSYTAGSVALSDNDSGTAMFTTLTSAAPTDSDTSCIKVRSDGTLSSTVRLYGTISGALAPYLTLTVTRGTDSSPTFDNCATFTADGTNYIGSGAGVIYSGALGSFPTTYAGGLVDPTSGSPETWTQNEEHIYKFVLTLGSNTSGQGQTASAGVTWEARNQ
ncbi:MAG: hypothetical protein ACXWYS_02725 [Gaiellaceae bacterium]